MEGAGTFAMNQLNAWKIGLLQVLITAYPVLTENGIKLQRPIALIGEDEKAMQLLWNQLCLFPEQRMIPLSVMPKELEKKWLESEYGVFYCSYNRGRYTRQNIEQIAVKCQMVDDGIEHQKLVLLFSNCCIPEEVDVEGTMFFSHFDEVAPLKFDVAKFIHFCLKNEIRLLQKVREGVNGIGIQEAHPILAAAKILLENYAISESSMEEIPDFLQRTCCLQDKVYEEWESTENPEIYAIALNRAIMECADFLPPVLNREYIKAEDIGGINEAIFYDEFAYYLPEQFFLFFCERCISSASVAYVKSKLAEAGVLVLEGKARNYFTVKIEVVTVYGSILRVRRMKILREKFDQYGEFSVEELYKMSREERYESEELEDCETWEA